MKTKKYTPTKVKAKYNILTEQELSWLYMTDNSKCTFGTETAAKKFLRNCKLFFEGELSERDTKLTTRYCVFKIRSNSRYYIEQSMNEEQESRIAFRMMNEFVQKNKADMMQRSERIKAGLKHKKEKAAV